MNVRLVAGLGNPGPRFTGTRHNAGYLVLDALAQRLGERFRSRGKADIVRSGALWLVKPTTFMNDSGSAVLAVLSREGVHPSELLVVHDDVDLPLGRLRFKQGGGAGGQKGVKDIIDRIGPGFLRLKIGVGRPPADWTTVNWVLSRFSDAESHLLEQVVAAGTDAVQMLVASGLEPAMNAVNGLDLTAPQGVPSATTRPGSETTEE